jgi:hypothetical protein
MIKLPSQTAGRAYPREFSTRMSRALLGSLLRAEITSQDELVAWLDRNAVEYR